MDKKILEELCEKGLTIRQIAVEMGCSFTNIRYWLRKFGIKVKRGGRGKLPKDMLVCRKCGCGETDVDKFYGNKKRICGKCHNQYVIRKSKEQSIRMRNYLGGQCVICGYKKYFSAMDIHHLKPEKKDVSFRSIRKWKWEKVVKELEDCVLLCKCCHSAFHGGEMSDEEQEILKRTVVRV